MSFFALSQAPPPAVIAIARNRPVTIVPIRSPPSIFALIRPTTIGKRIGTIAGRIIDLIAEPVTMSIARPYGPLGAFHDPRVLAELRAHLLHDLAADAPDRLHRERREQERHQAADEEAGDHAGIPKVEQCRQSLLGQPVGVRAEEDER